MGTLVAIIASDLHVRNNDRTWDDRHDLTGDTSFALAQIAQYVEQVSPRSIPVLLAGDNFQSKLQRSDAIKTMRKFIFRLAANGSPVYFVEGQHELAKPTLMSAISDWPIDVDKKQFQLGPFSCYGLSYRPPGQVEIELRNVPPCDILLTHQVWREFLGDNGEVSMMEIPNAKMMITGDYHKAIEREYACAGGPMRVLSPGSVCMQKIDETPVKFIYELYDDMRIQPIMLKTRRYCEVAITSDESLTMLLETDWTNYAFAQPDPHLPDALQKSICRVYYPQKRADIFGRIKEALSDKFHLFFKPMPTQETVELTANNQMRRMAVQQGFPGIVRTFFNDDPVAANVAIRMNDAENLDEEIQMIYEELLRGEECTIASQSDS